MKKVFFVLAVSLMGISLTAQSNFSGLWNMGVDNTLVKIVQTDGAYCGEIVSSDNPKAKVGTKIIKELKLDKGEWKGQLYSVKRDKWAKVKMKTDEDLLLVTILIRPLKVKLEWEKVEP